MFPRQNHSFCTVSVLCLDQGSFYLWQGFTDWTVKFSWMWKDESMYTLIYQKENLKKEILQRKKEKSSCMSSVGNMEGHWNICSVALAVKCFSKEAGVVLSFSSFDYLVSLTSLYVRLYAKPSASQECADGAAGQQKYCRGLCFMLFVDCWLHFSISKNSRADSKRKGSLPARIPPLWKKTMSTFFSIPVHQADRK